MRNDLFHISDTRKASAAGVSSTMGYNSYVQGLQCGANLEVGKVYVLGSGAKAPGYEVNVLINGTHSVVDTSPQVLVLATSGTQALVIPTALSNTAYNTEWDTSNGGQCLSKDLMTVSRSGTVDNWINFNVKNCFGGLLNVISDAYFPKVFKKDENLLLNGSNYIMRVYWQGTWTDAYSSAILDFYDACYNRLIADGSALYGSGFWWTGTYDYSDHEYYISTMSREVRSQYSGNDAGVAPTFVIDTSRIAVVNYQNDRLTLNGNGLFNSCGGNTIVYTTYNNSTSINASQGVTSVEEGASVDLSQIITGVTYAKYSVS